MFYNNYNKYYPHILITAYCGTVFVHLASAVSILGHENNKIESYFQVRKTSQKIFRLKHRHPCKHVFRHSIHTRKYNMLKQNLNIF